MSKVLKKIPVIFDRIEVSLAVVSCAIIAFITLAVCYTVVLRYFFHSAVDWSAEVSRISLAYITFFSAAWVLKKNGHVKVDILTNYLSLRTQALVNMIHSIISAIACLVIIWYGVIVTVESIQIGYRLESELRTPQFLILIVVPMGLSLFFIRFLRKAFEYWTSFRRGVAAQVKVLEPEAK